MMFRVRSLMYGDDADSDSITAEMDYSFKMAVSKGFCVDIMYQSISLLYIYIRLTVVARTKVCSRS